MIVGNHTLYEERGEKIVREWCGVLDAQSGTEAYVSGAESRRFNNPVAYHVDKTAHDVVRYVFSEGAESLPESVEDLCRLQALQDPKASSMLVSFFKLRAIIASNMKDKTIDGNRMLAIDARIDDCALCAMDYFSQCREEIMQFCIDEIKRRDKMLERYVETVRKKTEKESA